MINIFHHSIKQRVILSPVTKNDHTRLKQRGYYLLYDRLKIEEKKSRTWSIQSISRIIREANKDQDLP